MNKLITFQYVIQCIMFIRWINIIKKNSCEIHQPTQECVSRILNICKMNDVGKHNQLYANLLLFIWRFDAWKVLH